MNVVAKPTNADLQRQIYGVETEMRSCNAEVKASIERMSCKLDKALEHSAAHKARLDAHDTAIVDVKRDMSDEIKARDGQFMWVIGSGLTALLALVAVALEWAKGGR